ncbi:GtrA family protein [Faunimonas pinastri]|nr:GtrA family protein [Faunimonas pinastri]
MIQTSLSPRLIRRVFGFAFVGGVAFFVDIGVLTALHYGAGQDPFTSRLISIALATLIAWQLNRRITFEPSGKHPAHEGMRYAMVAALSSSINYSLYTALLVTVPALPPTFATAFSSAFSVGISFLGYSRFVFGARP